MRSRVIVALLLVALAVSAADARQWSWLGVRIRDLSEQEMEEIAARHGIREGFGVVIVEVIEGAPAEKAGLKAGDIVVAFDGRPVTETRLLQRLIAAAPTERETPLTVLRAEGRQRVAVKLAAMPRAIIGERIAAEFGFIVREPEGPGAAAPSIAVVIRGSSAEKAGLEAGDVILQVNEQAVVSREAAREALADAVPERPLRLTVRRGQSHLSVTLNTP
ncbi:MAG: PDZ domain-containing protein [candidate division NC10 bacterium]